MIKNKRNGYNNNNIKKGVLEMSVIVEVKKEEKMEKSIDKLDDKIEEVKEVRNEIVEESEEVMQLLIDEVISDVDKNKYKDYEWWNAIPRRDRYRQGDIIFNDRIERFGIFVAAARKEGLIRMRLFKRNTKFRVYTRDWFVDFNETVLVRRRKSKNIQRGFVNTSKEFLERPGRVKERLEDELGIDIEEMIENENK